VGVGFIRILFLAFASCLAATAFAYISVAEESSDKIIQAVRIEPDKAPVIDGELDDECWKKADGVADFMQFEPDLGAPPRDLTKVYVLFDRERLYIGFECLKKDPDEVLGTEMKRDARFFQDDFVEVFLDTYRDRRNCYGFAVNCLGTQCDRRIANEGSGRTGGPRGDRSRAWDCSWEAMAARTDSGWTAEMAIPFSELRFDKNGDGTWGINFWRGNEQFDEEDTWADVGEREYAVSRFGILTGLIPADLVVSRPIELKPYITVKPRISPERDVDTAAGIDVRYPASTITVDLTFNPDFAQIEADPARINLEDVEMRLAEKRPFFQEGMELFQTPMELFYTRRAGAKKLMYGAKAVGKLGPYNLALLDCQSDDTVELDEEEEPEEEPEDETKNNYFVLRAQRDVGTNSSIGFLGVNKQKADGYNRAGAVDFNTNLPMDMKLMGQYARSWRPDKNDDAFNIKLDKRTRSLSFDLGCSSVGPDFEVESGFVPRTDRRGFGGGMRYEYSRDAKILRMLSVRTGYEWLQNHDGIKTNERIGLDLMARISDFFIAVEPGWYYHVSEDDESIFYTDRTISSFAGWFPPRWASVRCRTVVGKREGKDMFFIGPEVSITPLEKLRLEIEIERLDEEGARLMLNRRFSASYQFTHQMFLRASLEVTRDEQRNIFAVYGWEYRPENHFFLVYSDNKEWDTVDRIIFVKLSYLLKWNIF
jgi:hypothetical protein